MAFRVCTPWILGRSHQLSQNKFFDPMSRSNRKGCDGEVVVEEVKKSVKFWDLTILRI